LNAFKILSTSIWLFFGPINIFFGFGRLKEVSLGISFGDKGVVGEIDSCSLVPSGDF